jgi:serine protease
VHDGDGILSLLNAGLTSAAGDDYIFYRGTSMAAPHVAGVAGLLYGANPAITPDEVVSILQQTSQPFPPVAVRPCNTSECGAGILDAGAAVSFALQIAKRTTGQ